MSEAASEISALDNISKARLNMIENQVRAGGMTNRKVLAAMARLPRENFVKTPEGALAYAEVDAKLDNIKLDNNSSDRFLLSPPLLARLIDAAGIHDGDLVLDIGCANGYSTAILSDLVGIGTVVGLESDEGLAARASQQLEILGKNNVVIVRGSLIEGYPQQGPYDVIILNGASAITPKMLESIFIPQLRMNGRFVGVYDDGGDIKGVAWRWTKTEQGVRYEALFDARTAILPSFDALAVPFRFPGIEVKNPSLNIQQSLLSDKPPKQKQEQTQEQTQEQKWNEEESKEISAKSSRSTSVESRESSSAGSHVGTTQTEESPPKNSPKNSEEITEALSVRETGGSSSLSTGGGDKNKQPMLKQKLSALAQRGESVLSASLQKTKAYGASSLKNLSALGKVAEVSKSILTKQALSAKVSEQDAQGAQKAFRSVADAPSSPATPNADSKTLSKTSEKTSPPPEEKKRPMFNLFARGSLTKSAAAVPEPKPSVSKTSSPKKPIKKMGELMAQTSGSALEPPSPRLAKETATMPQGSPSKSAAQKKPTNKRTKESNQAAHQAIGDDPKSAPEANNQQIKMGQKTGQKKDKE